LALAAAALFLGGCPPPKPKPPTASFTFSPSNPAAGDAVTFQGSAGGAFPAPSYSWDFGDGSASSGASASHVYGKAGNYTVTLTEKNAGGSSSASNTIPVSPGAPLTAGFSFSPTNPTAKHLVTFTNLSTGGPEPTYFWSFGDGANSTDKNPTHTYTA